MALAKQSPAISRHRGHRSRPVHLAKGLDKIVGEITAAGGRAFALPWT